MSRYIVCSLLMLVFYGCGDPCKESEGVKECPGISECIDIGEECPHPSDMMMEDDASVDGGINDDMSMPPPEPENGSDLSCDDQFVASVSGSFTNDSGNINFVARVNPDGEGALTYNSGGFSDNLNIKVRVADGNGYPTNIGDPNANGVFDIQLGYTNGHVKTASMFVYNAWSVVSSRNDGILMQAKDVDKNQGEIDAYPSVGNAVNFKTTNTDNGKGYTIEMQDQSGNAGWLKFTYRCTGYN